MRPGAVICFCLPAKVDEDTVGEFIASQQLFLHTTDLARYHQLRCHCRSSKLLPNYHNLTLRLRYDYID